MNEGPCLSGKGRKESKKIPNICLGLYVHMYEYVTHTHTCISHRETYEKKKRSKIFKLRNPRDGSVDKVFAPREDVNPGLT